MSHLTTPGPAAGCRRTRRPAPPAFRSISLPTAIVIATTPSIFSVLLRPRRIDVPRGILLDDGFGHASVHHLVVRVHDLLGDHEPLDLLRRRRLAHVPPP